MSISPTYNRFKHNHQGTVPRRSDPALVLTSISQTQPIKTPVDGLVLYRRSLKILKKTIPLPSREQEFSFDLETQCRKWLWKNNRYPEPKKRGHVSSFSRKSKARLNHMTANSLCDYVSMFTATYDEAQAPDNGIEAKKDLNRFLVRLRKEFPDLKYLWVLEFQANGNPHFHIFTTIEYSPGYARFLGYLWNLSVKGSDKHLRVHQYVPDHCYQRKVGKSDKHGSFCPWEMGTGSYITYKYLSKGKQKSVPARFSDVGRFWGASRGIVASIRGIAESEFSSLFEDTINTVTGEFTTANQHIQRFFRDLRNYHERRVNRARWKNYHREKLEANGRYEVRKPRKFVSPLRRVCDATIANGTSFYRKWFEAYQSGFEMPF